MVIDKFKILNKKTIPKVTLTLRSMKEFLPLDVKNELNIN